MTKTSKLQSKIKTITALSCLIVASLLQSDKNITVQATQNLTLKGDQGVSIESSGGDVQIKGMNIKNSADIEFSAEGSATASLESSGQTTIKGAIVMIN